MCSRDARRNRRVSSKAWIPAPNAGMTEQAETLNRLIDLMSRVVRGGLCLGDADQSRAEQAVVDLVAGLHNLNDRPRRQRRLRSGIFFRGRHQHRREKMA